MDVRQEGVGEVGLPDSFAPWVAAVGGVTTIGPVPVHPASRRRREPARVVDLVETGENRTPRPEESRPEYPTGLFGVWVSPAVPPPTEARKASRLVLGTPHRRQGCRTSTLRRRVPTHRGEVGVDVACLLGGQGELRFASYFRHRFNEGDGYLGLQSRFDLPCRTLSSPQGTGESSLLYHKRMAVGAAPLPQGTQRDITFTSGKGSCS